MGCDVENESKASLIVNDVGSMMSEIQDTVMKTETLNTRNHFLCPLVTCASRHEDLGGSVVNVVFSYYCVLQHDFVVCFHIFFMD